jgi:hypothetical protein
MPCLPPRGRQASPLMLISLDPKDGAEIVIRGTRQELDALAMMLINASDRGEAIGVMRTKTRRRKVLVERQGN